jgi:hypothetical protein
VLDKADGYVRRVLFTPDNPSEFKRALDEAIGRYREMPVS